MAKKNQEIHSLSETDIKNTEIELRMNLQKSRFTHSVKGLDKPSELRTMRKQIARLKTEQRSREIAAMSDAQKSQRSKIRERRKRTK